MVVWEDRGVLKPPKPPIVHATGIVGNFRRVKISKTVIFVSKNSLPALHCMRSGKPCLRFHGGQLAHKDNKNYTLYGILLSNVHTSEAV